MKDKGKRFLCPSLILFCIFIGCGSEPSKEPVSDKQLSDESLSDEPISEAPMSEEYADHVEQPGFFSDLPRFLDPDEIRQIHPLASISERLNQRYELIINRHRDLIKDARLIDFGSYDGRWTYAAIDAGAKRVTAIEISPEFVARAEENMQALDVPPEKYDFIRGDILEELRKMTPGSFDGVLCLGVFYHITYHVELLKELKRIGVKWIIMDTQIHGGEQPVVYFKINPNYGLQGTPTKSVVEMMLQSTGFKYKQIPTKHLSGPSTEDYRRGMRITYTIFCP